VAFTPMPSPARGGASRQDQDFAVFINDGILNDNVASPGGERAGLAPTWFRDHSMLLSTLQRSPRPVNRKALPSALHPRSVSRAVLNIIARVRGDSSTNTLVKANARFGFWSCRIHEQLA